jgi:hypothetical protein
MEINYRSVLNNLLSDLPSRKKEILERRFGLREGSGETLQSIGDDLGITRERVRQLINDTLNFIKEKKGQVLEKPVKYLSDYFQKNGGLKKEEVIFQEIAQEKFKGHVSFFLTIGPDFKRFNEDNEYYSFWTIEETAVVRAKRTITVAVKKLEKKKEPTPLEELKSMAASSLHTRAFVSYIEISKHISQSPEGLFGLIFWPEINPKGVRDKAYLVLKRAGRPMHFAEITQKINELPFTRKSVLAESVHNELIRSPLFILVGRGIYALSEWGYEPGTVKDIIIKVLKEAKEPLPKEVVVEKVLSQRQVKENTILLNLQDKTYFIRTSEGRYYLKEEFLSSIG